MSHCSFRNQQRVLSTPDDYWIGTFCGGLWIAHKKGGPWFSSRRVWLHTSQSQTCNALSAWRTTKGPLQILLTSCVSKKRVSLLRNMGRYIGCCQNPASQLINNLFHSHEGNLFGTFTIHSDLFRQGPRDIDFEKYCVRCPRGRGRTRCLFRSKKLILSKNL